MNAQRKKLKMNDSVKQKKCRICGKFLQKLTIIRGDTPQWKCFNCIKINDESEIYKQNDWLNGNYHRAKINKGAIESELELMDGED